MVRLGELLEDGRWEAARALLAARPLRPAERRARIGFVRALMEGRRYALASMILKLFLQSGARLSPAEASVLVRALAGAGRFRDAQAVAAQLGVAEAELDHLRQGQAEALARDRNYEGLIEALAPLPPEAGERECLLLARAYQAVGDSDKAIALLEQHLQSEDVSPRLVQEYANLLYWQGRLLNHPGIERLLAEAARTAVGKTSHILLARWGAILADRRDAPTFAELLLLALEKDYPLDRVLQFALRLPRPLLAQVVPKAHAQALRSYRANSGVWRRLAQARLALGQTEAARNALAKALAAAATTEEWADAASLCEDSDHLDLLEQAKPLAPRPAARHGAGSEGWRDLLPDGSVQATTLDSDRALVAFGNLTLDNRVDMDPLLEALRRRGIALVLVRDRRRQIYVNGFGEFFPEREKAFAALRAALFEAGVRRSLTIGFSAGGYAAMRYGVAIGADGALILSGVSRLPDPFDAEEPRAHATLNRIRKVRAPDYPDLIPLLRENPAFRVHCHYPEGSALDRNQALRLRTLPSVNTFGVPQVRHMVWSYWTPGRWGRVLDQLLDEVGWPAAASDDGAQLSR